MTAPVVLAVRQLQADGVPPQRPHVDPNLPTTPGSLIHASAVGDHRVRVWEMHDDHDWYDTFGDRRHRPGQLRLVEILKVAPSLDGAA